MKNKKSEHEQNIGFPLYHCFEVTTTFSLSCGAFLKQGYPQFSSIGQWMLVVFSILNHPAMGVAPFLGSPPEPRPAVGWEARLLSWGGRILEETWPPAAVKCDVGLWNVRKWMIQGVPKSISSRDFPVQTNHVGLPLFQEKLYGNYFMQFSLCSIRVQHRLARGTSKKLTVKLGCWAVQHRLVMAVYGCVLR